MIMSKCIVVRKNRDLILRLSKGDEVIALHECFPLILSRRHEKPMDRVDGPEAWSFLKDYDERKGIRATYVLSRLGLRWFW